MEKATSILVIHPLTGQVLGATRRGTTDQWGLIGGKKDEGETIQACAKREFEEETGVMLESIPIFQFHGICEAGADGREFDVCTFMVMDTRDISKICKAFEQHHEVEPGITVGFIDYAEVLKGPFAKYNSALLNQMLVKPARCGRIILY